MKAVELRDRVDKMLSEGYRLWRQSGLQLPSAEERAIAADALASAYDGPHAAELAAACQSFHFFRKLHRMSQVSPTWSTLLGDYFFSQFSKYLIPLDSVRLTDTFSAYLKKDIYSPGDAPEYGAFICGLPAVLKG